MKKQGKIFYGWLLCLTGTLMLVGGSGIVVNSASQFLKPVCQALGVSRGQFSLYLSMVSVASMVCCPLIGKVFEKWHPKAATIFGGLFMALCWAGLSFATDIRLFYVLGFLIGIGSSLCGMVSVNILMNNWFHAKKGTAMGIALTGTGIGSMIFNPVASSLILSMGYQAAYRVLAVCMLACMLPLFLLYRYRPQEMGLVPLGLERADSGEGERKTAPALEGLTRSEAMKLPRLWVLCFVIFGLSASSMGLFNHLMAYFTDIGYEQTTAASMLSVVSLGMMFGKLFFGWLNDKIGTRRNFVLMTALGLSGILLLSVARSEALTLAAAALFGIATASPFVLTPQLTIYFFGNRDFANIYGFVNVFQFLGPTLGPPISGMIFDRSGSYGPAFVLFAALLFAVLAVGTVLLKTGRFGAAVRS